MANQFFQCPVEEVPAKNPLGWKTFSRAVASGKVRSTGKSDTSLSDFGSR